MDCTSNCLSKHHGNYLTSAFSCEDITTLKTIIEQKCSNTLRNSDVHGRTIFHICSSVGRYDVLSWLLNQSKTANMLMTKDKESGWSSLHRALYYGHIDCAILIYDIVQDWYALDAEGNSPLDLVVFDSPRTKKNKSKKERLAVAVLPFESGEAGELTLHCGDIVEILYTNRSGWAVGRIQGNGFRGLFPFNFVEEYKPDVPVEPCKRFEPINDVWLWGSNVNFALGLGDSKNRVNPELLESLWLDKKNVKDCVVTKFHSVILTDCGNVFTCGHGLGGRLGHGNEETLLYPKFIQYFENIHCTAISAAYSHTIVLNEMGQVYTFGFNDFNQLGHHPSPLHSFSPRQINSKSLKNKKIAGVAAGRFHSVVYTLYEIFTFGLNAGQLGHPKGEKSILIPKLVTHLYKKDLSITTVVASDGATVCLLANGDLYLFQDYVCRKIAQRMLDVSVISVTGGVLQTTDLDSFNKPEPLRIAILHQSGVVNVWRTGFNTLKMCYWLGQKLVNYKIVHISIGRHLILTADTGQVYFGHFLNKYITNETQLNGSHSNITSKKVEVQSANFSLSQINEKYRKERSECEEINLVKVPLLYRCIKCFCDSKSRTFAAIQSDARIGLTQYPLVEKSKIKEDLLHLLSNASLNDDIHDMIIKLKSENIPVHRFILECRLDINDLMNYKDDCSDENKLIYNLSCTKEDATKWLEKVYVGEDTTSTPLKLFKTKPEINDISFAQNLSSLALVDLESPFDDNFIDNIQSKKNSRKKRSAFSVHQNRKKSGKTMNGSKVIVTLGSMNDWKNQNESSDVSIESEDECIFYCHKCILISRTEYFQNMLSDTWIESSICEGGILKMPIPGNVLEVVLNFLYSDEANNCLKDINDITLIGEVLVCADQLLLTRLKHICELELAEKVYLKNAIEIFQFACDYGAEQLKFFICEFISLNLAYFLEAKLFSNLSNGYLNILSQEYRAMVVGMNERMIKPSFKHRETDELEKSIQESVTNDINKIKSRRGRLSSLSSLSVSDIENSICLQQLDIDVFENRFPDCKSQELERLDNTENEKTINNVESIEIRETEITDTPRKIKNNAQISPKESNTSKNKVWNRNPSSSQKVLSGDVFSINDFAAKKKSISPFKKKSQKDRKMERFPTDHVSDEESSSKEKEIEKSICPWATPNKTPQVSFRDVLSEEKLPLNESSQLKRKKRSFHPTCKSEKKGDNPWHSPTNSESNNTQMHSFTKIIHVQQEEKKQLTEQSKKPLSVIQLEEKAIEELYKHYEFVTAQGEYITIKRIKPVVATPFWEVDINQL